MAILDITRSGTGATPGLTTHLFGAFARWNDIRTTRKALMQLSDRELDDIGLTRGDLERVARR